jgi:VIT1/CCC1 family predicted Fe2+/Mn2+ transporter
MRARGQGHLVSRIGWLRAAVLGANDGIISTSSLIVGIATAATETSTVLLTGVAALVAGAISMAAGEYVSVSSQADLEAADRAREEREQREEPAEEREELAEIYRERGLDPPLARKVADQLMARDPVGSHLRDELGFSEDTAARPVQAALASAACFCAGAIVPVLMVLLVPRGALVIALVIATLLLLALLGAIGARAGGADMLRGAARVTFWGALAMAATAAIGALFGTSV